MPRKATRWSILGANLPLWATQLGIEIPDLFHHTSLHTPRWNMSRVGAMELIVECDTPPRDMDLVTILTRADWAFTLCEGAYVFLAQTCALDTRTLHVGRVYPTRIAGINCTIVPQANDRDETLSYTIWTDASYSKYLTETINSILPFSS